ncbi:MAG: diadenylate cyclase CdaA [Lachnospiraceae bacterium]|nr:diadenylate cyclase CdaA [Lachnospiraceae bacterium]
MTRLIELLSGLLSRIYIPRVTITDVVEILIITVGVYYIMKWMKTTRAYRLMRGILLLLFLFVLAVVLRLSTILWLVARVGSVALIALVIIFQPELRKALESLGNRNFLQMLFRDGLTGRGELFSDKTITEVLRACSEMAEVKTGALIVIEQNIHLDEFIDTGIEIDGVTTSQLLLNIFEKNTPLHDGAVIMRGDRVLSATCYLPLSDNTRISKRLGTRHRAGLGISEVSDAFTIIVSEETGIISCAYEGGLDTGLSISDLREKMHRLQTFRMSEQKSGRSIWKRGRGDHEENNA